ncbi:tyrosyl-DNA phosphodiesterase 1 isoform X2 [Nicotiana tabacum]|uniref:Tyrosyl-DNA phosphodiesterase 1 isoform X2 n=1 Tax=Nicotiana tabacum TaxID=4097 RepID=A0A1S3ZY55_TOBAC|nr:PREDICTED: tyrosyl-DNA phosphodiesterase 1 isoform X2 [Nicotiana tabacum]
MSTSCQVQVGFLVPLSDNLEEDEKSSIPKIPLLEGFNWVGRDCIPVTDKRLSRKHLTVTATSTGSTDVLVEGTNPVVIRLKGERKKLLSGERWKIESGDVIELIPGHYLFKYVSTVPKDETSTINKQKRPFSEESITDKGQMHGKKKAREVCQEEASEKGNVLVAILSNYMVDMDWLLSACPALKRIPNVLIIHGEGDGVMEHMKRSKPANWVLHKPSLPIAYGTHHSKAMILVYPTGVRVIVHTANLIYVDWNNKSQGLWMQDFPWKDQNNLGKDGGFENDLVDYLSALKWPEFTANIPAFGSCKINSLFFKRFDYSSAAVRLIASVPGYHSGPSLKKWGHMKLRTILQECTFSKEFQKSPLIYQFSSLGSLDEKWMAELASSMSAGVSEDKKPLGIGEPLIVWPNVEDVRCSLEGYAAGNAVPSPLKNVEKQFLKKYWARWKASHTGRCRAMPHIKTFLRYNGQSLAWLLLTSSNLSKAAWGSLQKNNSQLMIRSYELGVLFLSSSVKRGCGFSCTDNGYPSEDETSMHEGKRIKLVTLAWKGKENDDSAEVIKLPVPYELPPKPYYPEDIPWSWDRRYTKKDVYGQVWPRQVKLYTNQDS